MAEFIKIGNEITVKPKLEGISYELINNKVYDLEFDRMLRTGTNSSDEDEIYEDII